MISLTYEEIRNKHFSAALVKLGAHSGFNGKQAYHIGRIVDKLLTFEKKCVFDENKIHVKYAKKNEDGTLYVPEEKQSINGYYEVDEAKIEDHEAEIKELMKEKIDLDKNKIPLTDLDHTGLTPAQVVAIEALLDMEE